MGWPTQVGVWTPLVRPRISCGLTSCHVAFAVWPCSCETAFAPWVMRRRQGRHVELGAVALDAEAEAQQPLDGHAARVGPAVAVEQGTGHPADEVRVEALVAGSDRRMDREHAVAAHDVEGIVERQARGDVLPRPFREQERGMAFVQVPHRGRQVELAQRPHAADAEHELLVQPHLATADVKDVRDRAVGVVVVRDVGVEQQDRDPPHLGDPDGGEQLAIGQRDADREGLAEPIERAAQDRQACELVVGVGVLLVPVGVDGLAEVALAVHAARRRPAAGPCPTRSSCGRRRGRRGRRSRCRATRGTRTPRRSRRSARGAPCRGGAGTSGPSRWTCTPRTPQTMSW